MKVAIPTHNRVELIGKLTLAYLERCGILTDDIDLFVSNEQELVKYSKHFYPTKIGRLINANTNNVRDKFNFIHSYYPQGEHVLVIEDDISSIDKVCGYNMLETITNLKEVAGSAFDLCEKNKTKLWGISSNDNPFFLKNQSNFCFKLVVANMYGFIAEQPPLLITQHTKTDYERTIIYTIKYGGVIRLDYLCARTRNYKNPGGMQDLPIEVRAAQEAESSNYLAARYPDLCKLNIKKGSKFAELSFISKRVKPNKNTLF